MSEVDLGVGIVVDTRSLGGLATARFAGSVVFVWSLAKAREDIEVSVDELEGVVGSIVGEGGRRTRATCSSSRSGSVATVGPDIAPLLEADLSDVN